MHTTERLFPTTTSFEAICAQIQHIPEFAWRRGTSDILGDHITGVRQEEAIQITDLRTAPGATEEGLYIECTAQSQERSERLMHLCAESLSAYIQTL